MPARMSFAIELDDEVQLATVKVGDEDADGSLPTELEAIELPVAQDLPEDLFRRSRFDSELPSQRPPMFRYRQSVPAFSHQMTTTY